jgi:hypothetical protein
MLKESVDKLWEHCEKVGVRHGQHEWNKMGHQLAEGDYGICPSVFLEHLNWLERHNLGFFGR